MAQTHGSNLVALGLGALLTIVTQTAIGIMLVAIALIKSGIFTVDQTIMIIYGAHLGSSVLTWLLASGIKGTPKQLVMAQALFNVFGVTAMVALFYVEVLAGTPLVKELLATLSPSLETQMALLVILFNWTVPALLTPFLPALERLLNRFWPPTRAEALAKIKYIQDHALASPDTAILLVRKEIIRLFGRLPRYLQSGRVRLGGGGPDEMETLHAAFGGLMREVDGVLSDLARDGGQGQEGESLVALYNLKDMVAAIEENVHLFCTQADPAKSAEASRAFFETLLESLDFLLVTAGAALAGDAEDRLVLERATADRGAVMEEMRRKYLGLEAGLDFAGKALLHSMSGLFERTVWLLNRLAGQMGDADCGPS